MDAIKVGSIAYMVREAETPPASVTKIVKRSIAPYSLHDEDIEDQHRFEDLVHPYDIHEVE